MTEPMKRGWGEFRRIFLWMRSTDSGQVELAASYIAPTDGYQIGLQSRGLLAGDKDVGFTIPVGPQQTPLGTVMLEMAVTAGLASGVRTITLTKVAGVKAGDRLLLFPSAELPAGYLLGHAPAATADGTVKVALLLPAIVVAAKVSIPCQLVRIG